MRRKKADRQTSDFPQPEVLVAIMNNQRDLEIAKTQHWYRIPVKSAERLIKNLRQMRHLAFYQTRIFQQEAYAINYVADVERITTAQRIELLPQEAGKRNVGALYYKLEITPLQRLTKPIPSRRLRRVTFITTTLDKFRRATEINDLFHTSPLEDVMWEALKKAGIDTERQYEIREPGVSYDLDFAIECRDGTKINVECNGDAYHSTKAARDRDRRRGAYLETKGWRVLRFGTDDIRQDVHGCVHQIRELMNRHGGPAERSLTYDLYQSETDLQLDLFKR